jgi:hypothetical protein
MDWLAEPLSLDFMQRAMIAGMLVGGLCAMIGVLPMPSSPNHPREMSHDPAVCA